VTVAATAAASASTFETLRPYLGFDLKEEAASGDDWSSRELLSCELAELVTERAGGEVSHKASSQEAAAGIRRLKLPGELGWSSAADASCINSVKFRPDFNFLRLSGLESGEEGQSFSLAIFSSISSEASSNSAKLLSMVSRIAGMEMGTIAFFDFLSDRGSLLATGDSAPSFCWERCVVGLRTEDRA
jgi:hypothetical protein